jgi:hypothetical protein
MRAIICNGGHRTGSTAVFNIILNVVAESGILGNDFRSVGANHSQIESFVNLHPIFLTTRYVIKTHDYYPETLNENIRLIYTYRSPLSSAASTKIVMPQETDDKIYDNCIKNYRNYLAYKNNDKVLVVKYEDIKNNILSVVKSIAVYLKVEISNEKCKNISNICNLEKAEAICKSLKIEADPFTQYRKNQISKYKGSDDYYEEILTKEFIERIKEGIKNENNKS